MPRRLPTARPSPKSSGAAEPVLDLETRLAEALAERDRALTELARVKAEVDARRVVSASAGETDPLPLPPEAGVGEVPLRYVLVDAVHAFLGGSLTWIRRLRRVAK